MFFKEGIQIAKKVLGYNWGQNIPRWKIIAKSLLLRIGNDTKHLGPNVAHAVAAKQLSFHMPMKPSASFKVQMAEPTFLVVGKEMDQLASECPHFNWEMVLIWQVNNYTPFLILNRSARNDSGQEARLQSHTLAIFNSNNKLRNLPLAQFSVALFFLIRMLAMASGNSALSPSL